MGPRIWKIFSVEFVFVGLVQGLYWHVLGPIFATYLVLLFFSFFFYFLQSVERPSLGLIHEQSVLKNSYREPVTFLVVALASYVLYCAISPPVAMQ